jgi:dsRNA-specific ribonuclease
LLLWAASQHSVKIVYRVVNSSKQDQQVVITFHGVEGY